MYDETSAQSRRALLVTDSNDSVYLEHAISNAGKAIVERIPTKEYSDAYAHGYGMYVFSGFTPKTLPTNAAVWLLNAADGTGNGSGLTYRDMQVPRDETGPDSYYTPQIYLGHFRSGKGAHARPCQKRYSHKAVCEIRCTP